MIALEEREKVRAFVKENHFVTLATTSEGIPHAATVFFAIDRDLFGYFVTKTDTQKYKNLINNNKVSIVATDNINHKTLQIQGTAEQVVFSAELDLNIMHLFEDTKNVQKWSLPILKMHEGDFAVFKVTPKQIRFGSFQWTKEHDKEYFETIL